MELNAMNLGLHIYFTEFVAMVVENLIKMVCSYSEYVSGLYFMKYNPFEILELKKVFSSQGTYFQNIFTQPLQKCLHLGELLALCIFFNTMEA